MTDRHPELDLAHRYAADLLDPAAAAAFEEHLLDCDQCQTEVRLAVGLRQLLRVAPASRQKPRASRTVGIAALLAASILGAVLWPRGADQRITALGRVQEPPAYIALSVRTIPRHGDSLFNSAMTAYVGHHYDLAITGLRSALALGVDTIPTQFFLASAELMAAHPGDAALGYGVVIATGSAAAAYLPEAHLYRARALLQLGRADDALVDLHAVRGPDDVIAARASSLADSVTQVLRR